MLAEERQSEILRIVNAHRSVTVADIQKRLRVSRETVRRDLLALEGRRELRRTHGGAISLESSEPHMAIRQMTNAEGKRAIARLAARLVPDGASVILAGGTTVQSVSDELTGRRNLTVVTNCVASCIKLCGRNGNRTHLLGGEVQPRNHATLGRDATEMLSKFFADFAIVSGGAISSQGQLMDFSREEAELHAQMLQSAATAIVVVDYRKFGRGAPALVPGLERATYLITDAEPAPAMSEVLGRLPLEVLVARLAG